MYTVLIVDDETSVLKSLSTNIAWQQLGVSTLLTASDGKRALEMLSSQQVNLVITDIKMPNMDGIALLGEIHSKYPDTLCILLTAYSEFEFARKAIQFGVENYLLKPLNSKELEETIENALDKIYLNQKITNNSFRYNILTRWVTGNITSEELSERSSLLGINLYLPEYCVIYLCSKDTSVSLSAYSKSCASGLSSSYELYKFMDNFGRYIFILGSSHILHDQIVLDFRAESVRQGVESSVVLAIGKTVYNANKLPESYKSAFGLLKSADMEESGMLVLTDEDSAEQEIDILIHKINSSFQQHDKQLLSEQFQFIASELYQAAVSSSAQSALALLKKSLYFFFSQEFPMFSEMQKLLFSRIQLLPVSTDKSVFESSVIDLLNYSHIQFCYYVKQFSPIIQVAIDYIHKYYSKDISIQDFSANNKISPAYLGYLFKKETGFFFNNYLTQYRISCSIPLLLNTSQKVNDIALNVGFTYPSYYISCFRKQKGMSPQKYRQL
ncbi:MAG: response regulator [Christensenellales bacterium]|jgi:two-component system response regulator YesN